MLDRSNFAADPLSDILSLLKPRNVACGAVDTGKACIAFPAGNGIKCHAVIAGEAWLAVDGDTGPLRLEAGDCLILPHGRPYRLTSDLGASPVDYRVILAGRSPGHITSWNGGGRATIVSAAFTIEERCGSLLLDMLPAVAHVRGDVGSELRRSLQQMMGELREPQPGGRLIVEHLATTLLAQALRAYVAHRENSAAGWLFALKDQRIGAAISAMHTEPARRWTVQGLAEHAGMSRTSFAVRFKRRVGSSPMEYLTRLRMLLASDRLATSDQGFPWWPRPLDTSPKAPSAVRSNAISAALPADLQLAQLGNLILNSRQQLRLPELCGMDDAGSVPRDLRPFGLSGQAGRLSGEFGNRALPIRRVAVPGLRAA